MVSVVPDKSQLKVAMSPWRPVWYCRHPVGPAMVSPQVYCLAWMDQVLVLVVSRVSTWMLMSTHWSVTSMNMCWPVLMPQISGGLFIPGAVTVIDSSLHFPMPWSELSTSDLAIGPVRSKAVRSSLILQTLARGQIL